MGCLPDSPHTEILGVVLDYAHMREMRYSVDSDGGTVDSGGEAQSQPRAVLLGSRYAAIAWLAFVVRAVFWGVSRTRDGE